MWIDPTYTVVKEMNIGHRDLSIVKTTDEDGFDTYHLIFGCLRTFSGTLSQCESEWRKHVRCINKNNKKKESTK
jgi:hypothetical protein